MLYAESVISSLGQLRDDNIHSRNLSVVEETSNVNRGCQLKPNRGKHDLE